MALIQFFDTLLFMSTVRKKHYLQPKIYHRRNDCLWRIFPLHLIYFIGNISFSVLSWLTIYKSCTVGSESYYEAYNDLAKNNANKDPYMYGIPHSMVGPLRAKQQLESGKFHVPSSSSVLNLLVDEIVTNLRIFFSAFDPDSQHRWSTYNFAPLFSDDCDRWVRALFACLPTDKKSANADPITTAHALYLRSLMYDAAWRIVDREYNQRFHDIDVRVAFRKDSSAMPQNKGYPIRPYSGERYWMYRTDNLLSFMSYADLTAENVWRCLGCHRWIEANHMGQPRKWCPACREKVRSIPRRKKAED